MSYASCQNHQIEEIDLTGDSDTQVSQDHDHHFDVQLYVLNHQQSLKNLTTVWHRNTDGTFHAIEKLNPSTYHQDRAIYLDRDGQVDEQWASQKWQQWSERDFHPAVEAFVEYNEASPELLVLESAKESISRGEDAVKDIWAEISCAKKTLDLAILAPNSRDPEILSAAMRIIFKDLAAEKKRQVKDEKVLDTVELTKECLDNHSRLVDIILGRSEPLAQEGTDIIQAMLSEMFGLPVPTMPEPAEEYMQQTMEGSMDEIEPELESESEIEYLWERSQPQDLMEIEAEESSGTESDDYDGDSTDEQFNEYDDNISEYSNYSATFANKSKRALRKEKRDRARRYRKELWNRFGLTVEDTEEDQDDMQEEEHRRIKRQKKTPNSLVEKPSESRTTADDKPQGLRQTTLNFNKVSKSRKLFSRGELKEKRVLDCEEEVEEEVEFVSSGPMHRNSKRHIKVPSGYRYQQTKPVSPGGRLVTRRWPGR